MSLYAIVNKITRPPVTDENGITEVYGTVTLDVYDSVTGLPADGNYLTIYFDKIVNGIDNQSQATAIGPSVQVYSGLLQRSGVDSYYVDFRITDYGQDTTPVVQPINDVKIISVDIIQKADINGVNGIVFTNAASSQLPLTYYIDDAGPLYPRFANISTGTHIAKVVDAGGNVATLSFYVPQTVNLLTQDPTKEVVSGNVSRWLAAYNPVFFTYQRRDFSVTGVTADGSNKAVLTVVENITGLAVNDYIYVNAGNYKGTVQVLAVSGGSVTINKTYSGNATGFMNSDDLRPYYKVLTEITYFNKDINDFEVYVYSHSPNPTNGLVWAELSGLLKSLVQPVDESDYTQVNYRDNNLSASFTIRYQEIWDGDASGDWVAIADPYFVVYSAMQLQAPFGGNLGQYVPFATNSSAKFVTDFKEPAYSPSYPFDIGFIYSEKLAGLSVYSQIALLDINRNVLPSGVINTYLLNEDSSFLLNEDGSRFIIASQDFGNNVLNTQLAERVGLNRLLINGSYPDEAYYIRLNLSYNNGANQVKVTEDKIIRIDKSIDVNSVYLRWVGLSGSWEYYRFVWNQEISLNVQNASTIKKYVEDWQNEQSIEETIYKEAAKGLKVMAEDLSVDDIKGLQSIKTSPKVQVMVNGNPLKWQTVTVSTGTFAEYETQLGYYAFSLQFSLPSLNIQGQ